MLTKIKLKKKPTKQNVQGNISLKITKTKPEIKT